MPPQGIINQEPIHPRGTINQEPTHPLDIISREPIPRQGITNQERTHPRGTINREPIHLLVIISPEQTLREIISLERIPNPRLNPLTISRKIHRLIPNQETPIPSLLEEGVITVEEDLEVEEVAEEDPGNLVSKHKA